MEPCHLNYIPDRLHTNDREPIQNFGVGEFLFFRCKPDKLSNPYNSITLAELSHNRKGNGGSPISTADDALYNIRPDKDFERYNDFVIRIITILDLTEDSQYDKAFTDSKDNKARITLLHDPVPCMYPHCFFRVWYNEEIATMDNKIDKKFHELRNQLKLEFTSMIYTETLSQTS